MDKERSKAGGMPPNLAIEPPSYDKAGMGNV